MGISQVWAPMFALLVLVIALARAGLLLRAGLIIGFAFSYFLLIGLADGSGSRLPDGRVALLVTLALIPLAAATLAVFLVRHIEAHGIVRRAYVRALDALLRSARGTTPDEPGHPRQVHAETAPEPVGPAEMP